MIWGVLIALAIIVASGVAVYSLYQMKGTAKNIAYLKKIKKEHDRYRKNVKIGFSMLDEFLSILKEERLYCTQLDLDVLQTNINEYNKITTLMDKLWDLDNLAGTLYYTTEYADTVKKLNKVLQEDIEELRTRIKSRQTRRFNLGK